MGLLDRFLDAIKLNDDYDDDEEFLDDEDFDDYEEDKPKNRFFKRFKENDIDDFDEFEDFDEPKPKKSSKKATGPAPKAPKADKPTEKTDRFSKEKQTHKAAGPKVTPIRGKRSLPAGMAVNVIRPKSMEDTQLIADTLLDNYTVLLNLEGLDTEMAQRIIDFTCGTTYSLNASLKKISSYIFILTPENVELTGDYEDILNGSIDLSMMKSQY
ncbi:MAG: cell division protein SepF [Lachnospiraceae bacterium]|nr:cell division protein SepF [Lachnospiraceae bacterium]